MGEPVVALKSVRRAFKGVVALADLTLAVPTGTITVLVGPNGAGKTTAARLITGALRAEQGEVRTFGLDPSGPAGAQVLLRCAVVSSKPALYDRLTGREHLTYAHPLFRLR